MLSVVTVFFTDGDVVCFHRRPSLLSTVVIRGRCCYLRRRRCRCRCRRRGMVWLSVAVCCCRLCSCLLPLAVVRCRCCRPSFAVVLAILALPEDPASPSVVRPRLLLLFIFLACCPSTLFAFAVVHRFRPRCSSLYLLSVLLKVQPQDRPRCGCVGSESWRGRGHRAPVPCLRRTYTLF